MTWFDLHPVALSLPGDYVHINNQHGLQNQNWTRGRCWTACFNLSSNFTWTSQELEDPHDSISYGCGRSPERRAPIVKSGPFEGFWYLAKGSYKEAPDSTRPTRGVFLYFEQTTPGQKKSFLVDKPILIQMLQTPSPAKPVPTPCWLALVQED